MRGGKASGASLSDRRQAEASAGQSADLKAFEDFFKGQFRPVMSLLLISGATHAEAEEATQQAMITAFQNWSSIDTPSAWVRTVALRYFSRMRGRDIARTSREIANATPTTMVDPSDPAATTEHDEWVTELLRSLPEGQRQVMALLVDGFTPGEISGMLGTSPAAVRNRLFEARRRLRAALADAHRE